MTGGQKRWTTRPNVVRVIWSSRPSVPAGVQETRGGTQPRRHAVGTQPRSRSTTTGGVRVRREDGRRYCGDEWD